MQPKTTSSRGWRRGWAGIRGGGTGEWGWGDGRGFKPRGAHVSAKVGFEPGSVLRADRAGVAEQLAAWRLKPARERGQVLCTAAQVLAANLHQRRKGRGRGGGALGELMHQASIRLGGTHDRRTHVKALHLSGEPQVYRVAVRRRQGSRAARHVQLGEGEGEVGRRPVWDNGRRSRGLQHGFSEALDGELELVRGLRQHEPHVHGVAARRRVAHGGARRRRRSNISHTGSNSAVAPVVASVVLTFTRAPKRLSHVRKRFISARARSRATTRSVARSPCSTCASGAIAARAHRTALAHGIHRVRSGAFLHGALLAFREHTCVSLCLSHDCDFFRVPFRSPAPPPTSTPPSSPTPRAFHCHVTAQS